MYTESYFWFLQPASLLNEFDWQFLYLFAGMFLAGLIFWVASMLIKHAIVLRTLKRWRSLFLSLGASGIIWGAFRYENTPIFAKRFWAGLIILIGLVWAFYILKYMVTKYRTDKREYEDSLVRNKYMPQPRR